MKLNEKVNLSVERMERRKGEKRIDSGKALYKKYFKDNLMHTNKIEDGLTNPSLILMQMNINNLFGASIMPQNLNSEANALDTEMQNGKQWVAVAGVDNSKEVTTKIDDDGNDNYGDLIVSSANMSRLGPFIRCKLENLDEAIEDNTEILILRAKE